MMRATRDMGIFTAASPPPRLSSFSSALREEPVITEPLSGELAWKTRGSRPGVWVNKGDFFDGEFRGVHERQITLSSVLYGLRTFAIDDEVLAVVVQPRQLRPASFELQTSTGATLLASDVKLGDGELRLSESALGEVRVPAFEIFELRRR